MAKLPPVPEVPLAAANEKRREQSPLPLCSHATDRGAITAASAWHNGSHARRVSQFRARRLTCSGAWIAAAGDNVDRVYYCLGKEPRYSKLTFRPAGGKRHRTLIAKEDHRATTHLLQLAAFVFFASSLRCTRRCSNCAGAVERAVPRTPGRSEGDRNR